MSKPKIEELTATYSQMADGNSIDSQQLLVISSEDAGAGKYFVIKTERWAFDNIQELIDTLTDFENRNKQLNN
jgi:hypothetical protein